MGVLASPLYLTRALLFVLLLYQVTNQAEILIATCLSPNQCLPVPPTCDIGPMVLLWAPEAPGSHTECNWRSLLLLWQQSFSVLNKGSVSYQDSQPVLLSIPVQRLRPCGGFPTSSIQLLSQPSAHPSRPGVGGRGRTDCQSRGLLFLCSIFPSPVTDF